MSEYFHITGYCQTRETYASGVASAALGGIHRLLAMSAKGIHGSALCGFPHLKLIAFAQDWNVFGLTSLSMQEESASALRCPSQAAQKACKPLPFSRRKAMLAFLHAWYGSELMEDDSFCGSDDPSHAKRARKPLSR
jgi:hypothetical protein